MCTTSQKQGPSLNPETGGEHHHPSHQTGKELLQHAPNPTSMPPTSYWSHIMHKQLVCIGCNIKASKWKPGAYSDAMYDPKKDPYNSPLPLQWYFKPSTPNVHLCPECMHDSNWDFIRPSANGRCQPCPKHFDSNRNHDWHLYKDQEVPKCIQQLIDSHEEQSKMNKSLLNLDKHFIKEQAMERAHICSMCCSTVRCSIYNDRQ